MLRKTSKLKKIFFSGIFLFTSISSNAAESGSNKEKKYVTSSVDCDVSLRDSSGSHARAVLDEKRPRIKMSGNITNYTLKKLKQTVLDVKERYRQAEIPMPITIHLNSVGGDPVAAIKIAKIIRENKFNTYVDRYCGSSCSLLFQAGIERFVSEDAVLMYHLPERDLSSQVKSGVIDDEKAQANKDIEEVFSNAYLTLDAPKELVDDLLLAREDQFYCGEVNLSYLSDLGVISAVELD